MADWFADDSFWETFYPAMFPAERFEATPAQVDQMLALTKFDGKDVLDLCCGPGRHSAELAARGFNVTGVDRSPFLLAKARERRSGVEWVHDDMRNFVRPGCYDLAINMFTSFGYFEDKEDDLRVLRNIHTSLRDGGVFLIDVIGKEHLAKVFRPAAAFTTPDGTTLVQRHEIFDDWTRIRNEWILVEGERAKRFAFHHTVYSAQELKDRIRAAGFGDVSVYGDLEGREYGTDARRLVAVARKDGGR
jgi:SAM-dependent methyltransferase